MSDETMRLYRGTEDPYEDVVSPLYGVVHAYPESAKSYASDYGDFTQVLEFSGKMFNYKDEVVQAVLRQGGGDECGQPYLGLPGGKWPTEVVDAMLAAGIDAIHCDELMLGAASEVMIINPNSIKLVKVIKPVEDEDLEDSYPVTAKQLIDEASSDGPIGFKTRKVSQPERELTTEPIEEPVEKSTEPSRPLTKADMTPEDRETLRRLASHRARLRGYSGGDDNPFQEYSGYTVSDARNHMTRIKQDIEAKYNIFHVTAQSTIDKRAALDAKKKQIRADVEAKIIKRFKHYLKARDIVSYYQYYGLKKAARYLRNTPFKTVSDAAKYYSKANRQKDSMLRRHVIGQTRDGFKRYMR